ncbi:MAG: right-handed parallel beta-helix repeat-containing protein [Candidatus Zixiibacteriota bacterium]|nr:MAG: right-handed parallel beta-helix repeat-containing protein [candidate division Zixibacteria bacterium]
MRRGLVTLVVFGLSILIWCGLSWAQCPEDTVDHGNCDTLHVTCFDCERTPGTGPFHIQVPLLVTHDQTAPVDSIAGFVIPLSWTRTNPSAFCSLSAYWNTNSTLYLYPDFSTRSIFRHIVNPADSTDTLLHNRMAHLADDFGGRDWDSRIVDVSTDEAYARVSVISTGTQDQGWWEGDRILLLTLTYVIEDSMHICLDSAHWPPTGQLLYTRADARSYVPRHDLPKCLWIGPPRMQVLSPNGGETWGVGTTQQITWITENYEGSKSNVKLEYSTNSGGSWLPIETSTPDTGSYAWIVPSTLSNNCRVRVSDPADEDPFDVSDADFSIVEPDFNLEAEPDTQEVQASYSVDFDVILTSLYGFASSCTLTVAGLPSGALASFDPNPVIPTDTSVMSISTTRATPPGTYDVTITATEQTKGQVEHSTQVVLIVTPPPDFSIGVEPDSQDVQASFSVDFDVILTSLYGFSLPCTLTVSGLPLDASASFDLNPATPTDTSVMNITTLRTTPSGTYTLTVTATELTKAQIQHSTQVTLVVTPPPDFTIEASPETLQVPQGGEDSYEVILTSLYGFSSPCTLTVFGLPLFASGQFDPGTVTPTDTSTLTITVPETTPTGTYTLTVRGTELVKGQIQHSTQVTLIVTPPPDFTIEASPETLQVWYGGDASYEVILTSLWGFNSPCTLTVSGVPTGVSGTFDPPTLVPTGTADLNITVSDTADTGFYSLTITATEIVGAKAVEHSTDVTLWVTPPPDFTIEVEPDSQEVQASFSADFDVILTSLYGFASPCTLTVSGLPLGASGSFLANPATPTDTSVMTITTTRDTPPGTYYLTVTATELAKAQAEHSTQVVLVVTSPPDFTIEADPDSQEVQASFSVDFDVILTSQYGFASPCTLTVSGLPLGASGSFVPNPATPTDTSTMTVSTTRATPPGTYYLTVTATELNKAQVEHSTQVILVVTPPPDFTIEVEPDSQEVQASFSVDFDVILTSLYGFASPCNLTATDLPSGASASFLPNPVTPTDTSVMTINTTRGTPPGTYYVTVTATELTKAQVEHSTQVVLVVTPPPDFTIEVDPDSQEVQASFSVDFDVTLTSLYGFGSPCTLTVTGLPADASAGFDANPVTPTGASVMSVNTERTTPTGTYYLTVTATELTKSQVEHSIQVALVVTPPPDFTVEASPETLQVLQGEVGDYQVILTSLYGFSSTCSLTVSGLPQDASGVFDPTALVPTDTSTLTITVAPTTPSGTYPLVITATEMGTRNQLEHSVEVILITGCVIIRVPADYPTIQEAIDVAVDCDTVLVAPGIHFGIGNRNIDFLGKAITVKSEKGPDSTVINCQDYDRAFYFHSSETAGSRLEGFSIINAEVVDRGAGILCVNSCPLIINCSVSSSRVSGQDGTGGGIACDNLASPTITNCTIVRNRSSEGGGIWCGMNCNPVIENSIIAFNIGGGIYGVHASSSCSISCSDVYGNSGYDYGGFISDQTGINGNISECPLFCDMSANWFSINTESYCAPANNDCQVLMGAWETGCDFLCGDATGDDLNDIADLVYLINYLFRFDPPPEPLQSGDANCDGEINIGDLVYLIVYLYKGGPAPIGCYYGP